MLWVFLFGSNALSIQDAAHYCPSNELNYIQNVALTEHFLSTEFQSEA